MVHMPRNEDFSDSAFVFPSIFEALRHSRWRIMPARECLSQCHVPMTRCNNISGLFFKEERPRVPHNRLGIVPGANYLMLSVVWHEGHNPCAHAPRTRVCCVPSSVRRLTSVFSRAIFIWLVVAKPSKTFWVMFNRATCCVASKGG